MKIQQLALWPFLLFLSAGWGGEFFHFYGPTKNLSFIHIKASPVISRVQLTGALAPLNFFVNGENKTESLETTPCADKDVGFYVNFQRYALEGTHQRFYVELQETGTTHLEIELISKAKCYRTTLPLSNNIFQQTIDRKEEVEDKQYKSPYPFSITGILNENEKVEMSNGKLSQSDGQATFETMLDEGENQFAGVVKHKDGTEEILSYKLTLERETFSLDRATLSLKKNGLDWSSETILLSQEIDQIEGRITPGWGLLINNQLVESDEEGNFKFALEWKHPELNLLFELTEPGRPKGQIFIKVRKLQVVDWSPLPPWYNPGHFEDRSLAIGFSLARYFLTKDPVTQQAVQEGFDFGPSLSFLYKYNQSHFYAWKIRYLNHYYTQSGRTSTEVVDQYQMSFLKVWELPLSFELGTGLSYRFAHKKTTVYSDYGAAQYQNENPNGFDLSMFLDRRFRMSRKWFVTSSLGLHISTGIPEKYDDSFFEIIYFSIAHLF